MSEQNVKQGHTMASYSSYAANRMPYTGPSYPQFTGQGLGIAAQTPLANMSNLKANLPTSSQATEGITAARPGYNNPMMVLPSGQTVPVSAVYAQQSSNEAAHMPYASANMYSALIQPSAAANYTWPYGMSAGLPGVEATSRGSFTGNEENTPVLPPFIGAAQPEYYGDYGMTMPAAITQHYIAGPIQPMKCKDNKSYEMVNLDELVNREPQIPRAVPALWTNQEELSLAKCLQNPEGITNVYIRGFMPGTTDEDLEHWASRFGEIESCKAIIDQDTGTCKGFGFVMYYSPAAAENCIRGFFHLGFQASYAQKSRNARLKDLEDRASTNIYCTGVPIDWNESDLSKHFLPYRAVSTKICRDVPSGVSKEVGFARFESREIAERVVKDFHSVHNEHDGVKLCLRFADTKAQKQLKQQSQERRNWRSREYSYSVEHTPSPTVTRLQTIATQISPVGSYQSPAGASQNFTPATSVSPPEIAGIQNKAVNAVRGSAWPMSGGLQTITNSATVARNVMPTNKQENPKFVSGVPIATESVNARTTKTPSPKKVTIKIEPASGKENTSTSPQATN